MQGTQAVKRKGSRRPTVTRSNRRDFLRAAGLGGLSLAGFSNGVPKLVSAAVAQTRDNKSVTTICTECSLGCSIVAETEASVWTDQRPGEDSPINIGGYCPRGAAVRQKVLSDRRLKYPMRLVSGRWERMSWPSAVKAIADKMRSIRGKHGPDSVYWAGSSHFSNEQAYLFRKLAAFWGTNNVDSQVRLCQSPTTAGVANMLGYGAMTNPVPDLQNARCVMLVGSNAAETHPIAMRHILEARRRTNAPLIVCDPRRTKTARDATEHVRLRPGTDIAFLWGVLRHVLASKRSDQEFVSQRTWGLEFVEKEVSKWTDDRVEQVSGVPAATTRAVAELLISHRPGAVLWGTGPMLHSNGTQVAIALTTLQLALGNIGKPGGGCGQLAGHDNARGASEMCVLSHSLPGYYGLKKGAWLHWLRVWDVPYQKMVERFGSERSMQTKGLPCSRISDGVLEAGSMIDQGSPLKAVVFWGHSVHGATRLHHSKKALEQLDLIVAVDPFAPFSAVLGDRTDNVFLLPAATQMETSGSVTSVSRTVQWREKVIEPLFDSKPDHEIMYLLARELGFAGDMFRNIAVRDDQPVIEDVFREARGGKLVTGEAGHSPERLKRHMANQASFDRVTLRASAGPGKGEYYGLPWPCWGTPDNGHPGSPILYDTSRSVSEGGIGFRARFGVVAPESWGKKLLLAEGSYPAKSVIRDGYPEMNMAAFRKLGWDKHLTASEKAEIAKINGDRTNWKTDLSGGLQRVSVEQGIAPFGNGKARMVVWTFPDPVPLHREPIFTTRRDLLPEFATYSDRQTYRLPTWYAALQESDLSSQFPLILTTGRAGDDSLGAGSLEFNPMLIEQRSQPHLQVHPDDAKELGLANGDPVWIETPDSGRAKLPVLLSSETARGLVFLPFHFAGRFQGRDLSAKYPEGAAPHFTHESGNAASTFGFDAITSSPACKATICRLRKV